jgi:LacI family transcriptional regulator
MASVVTVKDIALRAAVSIGTVSRVFNNHQNVTTEVRERVLQAAKELGYTGQAGQRTNTRADSAPFREIGRNNCRCEPILVADSSWSRA